MDMDCDNNDPMPQAWPGAAPPPTTSLALEKARAELEARGVSPDLVDASFIEIVEAEGIGFVTNTVVRRIAELDASPTEEALCGCGLLPEAARHIIAISTEFPHLRPDVVASQMFVPRERLENTPMPRPIAVRSMQVHLTPSWPVFAECQKLQGVGDLILQTLLVWEFGVNAVHQARTKLRTG
eukprot:TRINITY_DN33306_c0_g1_i1.p1 TRINITY_DN33306_c0_g1~~TRINITY_DN33306_c0_g1_i1.p1  ORF type:complete len:183 (+),score=23.39 TRINITY_DN33306_c0_g1_i1:77-625(+)